MSTKKIITNILTLIIFMCIVSCSTKHSPLQTINYKYYNAGRFIVKDTYDTSGNIVEKKYFNKDTIPDGAQITYYKNGKIKQWKWWDLINKYAYCTVYYNYDGSFDTFMGKPYVCVVQNHEQQLCIELVNPPYTKVALGYLDSFKGKLEKKIAYEPLMSDTTGWVILNKHQAKKGHKYTLQYMIVDSPNYNLMYQIKNELFNDANGKYPDGLNKDSVVSDLR